MRFRTIYEPVKADFTLTPEQPVALLGSCFSENIAARMCKALWRAANPLGTLYNPVSIARAVELTLILQEKEAIDAFSRSLFEGNDKKIHSWLFDSSFSAASGRECIDRFMNVRGLMSEISDAASAIFITLGTAHCYHLLSHTGEEDSPLSCGIVANCHKQPADLFSRSRLSVEEAASALSGLADKIHLRYPDMRIVFTLSPVRHLRDGFIGNRLSKATLMLAIEEAALSSPLISYFPAYEILNDDLRDYRFYASDLLHPSEEGVEYIWEFFKATYLDCSGEALLKEGERLLRRLEHRPLIASPEEREHEEKEAMTRINEFLALHPGMCLPK